MIGSNARTDSQRFSVMDPHIAQRLAKLQKKTNNHEISENHSKLSSGRVSQNWIVTFSLTQ